MYIVTLSFVFFIILASAPALPISGAIPPSDIESVSLILEIDSTTYTPLAFANVETIHVNRATQPLPPPSDGNVDDNLIDVRISQIDEVNTSSKSGVITRNTILSIGVILALFLLLLAGFSAVYGWKKVIIHETPNRRCSPPMDTMASIALFIASQAALYYTMRWVLDGISPDKKEDVKAKQLEALKRLGHSDLKLDEYEHIGGLDPIISSLRESIIYPLLYPNLFNSTSSLLSAPKGVLLFGPPGCGKTMLAKALAKESGATFINIAASVLTNKWYGESNKLVAGLFSLARKTQPSIIFIDEIDSFLRERTKGDHEVTGMMKAEFMTLWDGLTSASDRILVLGATNRPNDIDSAILRRMPKRFAIQLPNFEQRLKILNLMLKETKLVPNFPMSELAELTEGHSGSDLKEMCRNAAMVPVREYMRSTAHNTELMEKGQLEGFNLRPLTLEDFFAHDGTSALPPVEYDETRFTPGLD
ncbi:hypothetical protein H0H81_004725 [Sphagnurus paluster]|uniref:AAA+ ATPase domain-containing protein n=1 Tax=Sphagnurus paluster TaxID=117069 RepID=A0A9P7GQG2_9AGAR|nr:hypothetical protein H0H81_004725 [Sphagnurus paluster]